MTEQDLLRLVERVDNLELKLAYQEDTIEQLNQEITALNLENSTLKRQLKLLAEKFKETRGSAVASQAEETPPPHY